MPVITREEESISSSRAIFAVAIGKLRRNYRVVLATLMFLAWVVEGLSRRNSTYPDGVCYLDMASQVTDGNWHELINGYWSPGYPFLVSLWFSVFKPSLRDEVAYLHLLNSCLLLAAFFCFEYFLRGLLTHVAREVVAHGGNETALPARTFKVAGYTLFCWTSVSMVSSSWDTPDVLVYMAVLLAGGMMVRTAFTESGWRDSAALGIVLGTAYLAKAVMFPLSAAFLLFAASTAKTLRRTLWRLLISTIAFTLVAVPYVTLLSLSKGRFTFGDSGRINYIEFANRVPRYVHWQGNPPENGAPVHPTRVLLTHPLVFEFSKPIRGTYPPWYDPSYWYEGVRPRFHLAQQFEATRAVVDGYFDLFTQLGGLLAAVAVLVIAQGRIRRWFQWLQRNAFLWVPALAGLGIYLPIYMNPRFVPGFVVLLWGAAFVSLRGSSSETFKTAARTAVVTVVLLLGSQVVWSVFHSLARLASHRPASEVAAAVELNNMGLGKGDSVAFLGDALQDFYWAHLAQLRIVAEVRDDVGCDADVECRLRLVKLLSHLGAKALVTQTPPSLSGMDGWKPMGSTGYNVLVLPSER